MLDLTHLRLEDVQGVGTIELDLEPGKQAYVFIGANGVGKTRLLNTLDINFQIDLKEEPPVVFIETQDRGHFEEAAEKHWFPDARYARYGLFRRLARRIW